MLVAPVFCSLSLQAQQLSTGSVFGPDKNQTAIAQAALGLVGKKNLRFDDRSYPWDCSGTVLAALWLAGLDVRREYGSYDGNGVNRLFEIAEHHEIEYDLPLPEIGDIVFWDNTYDKNEDLKWNDPLTHVGIVVDVSSDGTITYVHHDYRRGITTAKMNLFYPDEKTSRLIDGTDREINSGMRMASDRYLNPDKWLSGQLFRGFGRFHVLLEKSPNTPVASSTRPN